MGLAVVVCAALFTAPSWYEAVIEHAAPVKPTFERFLVALPVAWALLLIVAAAMRPQRSAEPAQAVREVQASTTIENNPEP